MDTTMGTCGKYFEPCYGHPYSKNYVSRSDCNGCTDIHEQLMQECLRLKTENAILSGQISELKSIKNVGCQD